MLKSEVLNHKFNTSLGEGKTILNITGEEAIDAFKQAVEMRDMMSGAMYYNMFNEECHMLYDVCRDRGVDETIMSELYKELK